MDPKEYAAFLKTLPKKRMASGALFRDESDRILLVKPAYKEGWGLPGGVVEENESPKSACIREIKEELGLELPVGRMLLVDYNHPRDIRTESLMFIFDGGILPTKIKAQIQLCEEELLEWRFFDLDSLPLEMSQTLRERVLIAHRVVVAGSAIYLEDQRIK